MNKMFIVRKKKIITNDDLLQDLEATINRFGTKSLTMKEYDDKGIYNSSTVVRRFGSWNKALNLIDKPYNCIAHTIEEMMDNIRDAWLIKGEQPTRRDMDNKSLSKISSGSYVRKYGSWYNALDEFVVYISNKGLNINNLTSFECKYKHKTKREPSNRLKVQVLMRDGNKCRLCGVECNEGLHNIHFDHIIPWSRGGETVLDNLQILCSNCNLAKGNTK